MKVQTRFALEKFEVQATAVAGLALVYFALASLIRPTDPALPTVFLAGRLWGQLAVLAGLVAVLSAAAAVATLSVRPAGALAAALLAVGGLSLRSCPAVALLQYHTDELAGLMILLLLETLLLTAWLALAVAVVLAVRAAGARLLPAAMWQPPLAGLTDNERTRLAQLMELRADTPIELFLPASGPFGARLVTENGTKRPVANWAGRRRALQAACLLLAAAATLVVVLILGQSSLRGQVLAAVFFGGMLGMLLANYVLPAELGPLAAAPPMVLALLLYALALAGVSRGPLAWANLPVYATALPLDWLTAGAGGSLFGYWTSQRLHEAQMLEAVIEPPPPETATRKDASHG